MNQSDTSRDVVNQNRIGNALECDDADERLVLGALVDDRERSQLMFSGYLDPQLFVSPFGTGIFQAYLALEERGIEPTIITLTQEARAAGALDSVGGPYEITRLATEFRCDATIGLYHLQRMRDAAARRAAYRTGTWLIEQAQNLSIDARDIVVEVVERADRLRASHEVSYVCASSLSDLARPAPEDDSVLLGANRYVCRGGGVLWVGPTGVGKSSAGLQAALSWGLGRSFFGIPATRPLRSLIIQAENDDGDMAEMRDGVFDGMNLSADERACAGEMVFVHQDNRRSGLEFFARTVEPLLRLHTPDLLWIDPALSYIAGESNSQADVGRFLRNWLNPLLTRYRCAAIVTHHTNKPPSGKEKTEWSGSDLAYLGSGSAEWANWARAVVAIRSLGDNGVFELCLSKRGGRVGWRDESGAPIYTTLIAHAKEPGRIHWRNADESERPDGEKKTGRQETYSSAELLEILGSESITFADWFSRAHKQGWAATTFKRKLAEMKADKIIYHSKLDGTYTRQGPKGPNGSKSNLDQS